MNSQEIVKKIKIKVLKMLQAAKASHIGGIFSMSDILAVLYTDFMKINKDNVSDPDRNRFILSKGHNGAGVYAVLSEMGILSDSDISTYYKNGSKLSGHISHKDVDGVEFSTGSLGHGACAACGMALAAKLDAQLYNVYTIVGDGECDEGSIWEMALFANHYRLDNFTVIIDHNKMQSLDYCEKTIELLSLSDKWKSFGWNVIEIDGHDHAQINGALNADSVGKPKCIIAHTIKGKGVSFMENNVLWHYRDPQGEFFIKALEELENAQ